MVGKFDFDRFDHFVVQMNVWRVIRLLGCQSQNHPVTCDLVLTNFQLLGLEFDKN